MKKKLSMALPLILLFLALLPINATALSISRVFSPKGAAELPLIESSTINLGNGSVVEPQYEPACGTGPHIMYAQGWGDIINVTTNTTVVSYGACAQCTRCNLVIITQNEPDGVTPLGYYTTWKIDYQLNAIFTTIYQSSANIVHTTSTRIPGISFRYR